MSNQERKVLCLFTRTPLHVGAGSSVGAIDQPIIRERHTGVPVIPASSLKGSFADQWQADLEQGNKKFLRVTTRENEDKEHVVDVVQDSAWLFGSNNDKAAFTGAIQFGEGRVLAFPIRSAKGSYAWITCPLALRRAARDGVIRTAALNGLKEPADEKAIFDAGANSKVSLDGKIVLEEYCFENLAWLGLSALGETLAGLLPGDEIWNEITSRLVIVSDGMMSFFTQNACEIAQHVRISDETGTAEGGALFNQENVPGETLFYAVLNFTSGRGAKLREKTPGAAITEFAGKVDGKVFQFGGDASTGLGYCSTVLTETKKG
jgi:CRISPR-associated protein Cmr4